MQEVLTALGGFIIVFGFIFAIAYLIEIVLYVLQGIGIYKMSQNAGLKKAWLGFIPFARTFAFGRLAKNYVKRDRTPSAKFDVLLLVFEILPYVFLLIFVFVFLFLMVSIILEAETAYLEEVPLSDELFVGVIPVIISYFVALVSGIIYSVLYYVALWRVYSIYSHTNATAYLVISVLFRFMAPIFLFAIRNNAPKFTFEERNEIFIQPLATENTQKVDNEQITETE